MKDLRTHTREVIASVERGEEVILTYRGKAKAKIVPIGEGDRADVTASPLFGLWAGRDDLEDVSAVIDNLRRPRY